MKKAGKKDIDIIAEDIIRHHLIEYSLTSGNKKRFLELTSSNWRDKILRDQERLHFDIPIERLLKCIYESMAELYLNIFHQEIQKIDNEKILIIKVLTSSELNQVGRIILDFEGRILSYSPLSEIEELMCLVHQKIYWEGLSEMANV